MKNSRIFNAADSIMYFLNEFLLGLILFTPIISIIWGVNFDKNSGLSPAEVDEFVSYIITPSFFLSIAGLAFIYSIMMMLANFTFLLASFIIAFLVLMYTGFGMAGPAAACVPVIMFLLLKKNLRFSNFLINRANIMIDRWKDKKLQQQLKAENIFEMEKETSYESPAGKIVSAVIKTAFISGLILWLLALISGAGVQ